MRLKNININELSSSFEDQEQKEKLKEMSSCINNIGSVFDNMISLESFIIDNIQQELSSLISIREEKEKITNNEGLDKYLEYFKEAVDNLEFKIKELIIEWDKDTEKLSSKDIQDNIQILKSVSLTIKELDSSNTTVTLLNKIIDEFGYFRICKVIFCDNIVNRITILLNLKNEINTVFKNDNISKRKKLSIDDL